MQVRPVKRRSHVALPLMMSIALAGCGSVSDDAGVIPSVDTGGADTTVGDVTADTPADAAVDTHDASDAVDAFDTTGASDGADEFDSALAPLTIVSIDPPAGAVGVALDYPVSITFSRAVVAPASNVTLTPNVAGSVTSKLSADGKTLTFSTKGWPLLADVTTSVSHLVTAVDGAHLAADVAFHFRTRDGTWHTPFVLAPDGVFLDVALTADNRYAISNSGGVVVHLPTGPDVSETPGSTDVESAIVADELGKTFVGFRSAGGAAIRQYALGGTSTDFVLDTTAIPAPKVAVDTVAGGRIFGAWSGATGLFVAQMGHGPVLVPLVDPTSVKPSIYVFGIGAGGGYVGVGFCQTNGGVYGTRVSVATSTLSTTFALDAGATISWPTPKVAMAGDGGLFVAWISDTTAKVARVEASASIVTLDTAVAASSGSSQSITVAASASGDAIVAWPVVGKGVTARRYDAASKTWKPAVDLALTGATGYAHSSAMDAFGNALVVWTDAVGVWVVRYDRAADAWRTPVLLGAGGSAARVTLGLTGGLVAWEHPKLTLVQLY